MGKSFIRIDNALFEFKKNEFDEVQKVTKIHDIGTEGFTIYCYLLIEQGSKPMCNITLGAIQAVLNKGKDTKKKHCKEGLRDIRTIKTYLLKLKEHQYIECVELNKDTKKNESLIIKVNNSCDDKENFKGFSSISCDLFIDYIHIWGHIQWSMYCYLFKNHNVNYANENPGCFGFANPSEETIGDVIGRSERCIKGYVNKFPKSVIKVEQQPLYLTVVGGKVKNRQQSNHYTVFAKVDTSNKYYVGRDPKTGEDEQGDDTNNDENNVC